MTRTTIATAAVAALALLGACSAGSDGDTDADAVELEILAEDEAAVRVPSTDPADVEPLIQSAVDQIDSGQDDAGWFIYAVCGSEDDPVRIGQARFAKGERGAAQTGLPEGDFDFEFNGNDCP